MSYGPQVLWPEHCVQDTKGAEFHPASAHLVIRKGTNREVDSYSAFFENDKVTNTDLDGYLRDLGIKSVTLVGLALDFCVKFTALDAAKLGYDVSVVQDATRAIDLDGLLSGALANMRAHGIDIV